MRIEWGVGGKTCRDTMIANRELSARFAVESSSYDENCTLQSYHTIALKTNNKAFESLSVFPPNKSYEF